LTIAISRFLKNPTTLEELGGTTDTLPARVISPVTSTLTAFISSQTGPPLILVEMSFTNVSQFDMVRFRAFGPLPIFEELEPNLSLDFMSVAEKYDVLRRCELNQMCLRLVWDDRRQLWVCTFKDMNTGKITVREAEVVVSAVGTLDRPSYPEIEGASSFKGSIFHSARWDATVQVENKNVVVLGNGASATQFVPALLKEVGPKGSVTQLVKSAHYWTKRVS
jgi:cation diffusion facilitator CzcD-associated flavoprotein CzcO